MIQGKRSEKEYRQLAVDSSSSLKEFSINRKSYLKKYVLNEKVEEKDSQASLMGKIVEVLVLEPETFDDKFYLSACAKAPSEMMVDFLETLCSLTLQDEEENGEPTKTFEELSRAAHLSSGFKISYEQVIKKFSGTDSEIYYNEMLSVKRSNLAVVTANDVTIAENIRDRLKTNPFTAEIINLVESNKYSVCNQLQIEGFEIDGLPMKSMIDRVIANHFEKTLEIFDLKCVWSLENFIQDYYLFRRAYLQAYTYFKACQHLTKDVEHEWYGYKVLLPKFIVCDSTNYYAPLIYSLTEEAMNNAYNGFNYNEKYYPGVREIIENLMWAKTMNVWDVSRENYLNNGIVNI